MYTAPTKVLALCSAAGIASAAILIKANGLDQDLSLFNDPIDDNTNAIVLKQAGDAIPDTVFLEGSQLRFSRFSRPLPKSGASNLGVEPTCYRGEGVKTPALRSVC